MGESKRFVWTPEQQGRLLDCRAAWEEGEDEERLERLRQREEDAETLRAFAQVIERADFARGGDLTYSQMARLLALARALAPNPNLDARLLRRPGEPTTMNRDLRDLFYGSPSAPLRIRTFLGRRHAGEQTALQLLCAASSEEWPLVTRATLQALELTDEQRETAIQAARARYDLPEETESEHRTGIPDSDPVLRLLAHTFVFEAARETLEATDYMQVHRLLLHGLAERPRRARRRLPLYAPDRASASQVREEREGPGYQAFPDPPSPFPQAEADRPGAQMPLPDLAEVEPSAVLTDLERFVAQEGFTFPELTIRDYYLSLQTKPFCILAGVSGIGKTRLTSLFAEALTGRAQEQYRLLPVRPDWADSTPLLGYVNLLAGGGAGRYVGTPFLEFLWRASLPENAHRAYFLCLDEMNLARVEHYFAEILSAMETPNRDLLLPNGQVIALPDNLFFTGTLNIDEATHALSRKVLDRANTLAFTEVRLREMPAPSDRSPTSGASVAQRQALFLHGRVRSVAEARARLQAVSPIGQDFTGEVVEALAEANDRLQPHGLHFAYRVRDEALRYCANSFDRQGRGLLVPDAPTDAWNNLRTALDLQILQKVLPRLSGVAEQIEAPLNEIHGWAERRTFARTAEKLDRMRHRLRRDGFTGYEEA